MSNATTTTYANVLAVLTTDYLRSTVLALFKNNGGDRDRWNLKDQAAMAQALTTVEDALELQYSETHGKNARAEIYTARTNLRNIRRRLEDAVDEVNLARVIKVAEVLQ